MITGWDDDKYWEARFERQEVNREARREIELRSFANAEEGSDKEDDTSDCPLRSHGTARRPFTPERSDRGGE